MTSARSFPAVHVVRCVVLICVVAAGLIAVPGPAAAKEITCDDRVSGAGADFYDGPSASDRYDGLFAKGHAVPHLDTHVPQGMATWSNWRGDEDLLLITSYAPGSTANALIIALDAGTGKRVGTAEVNASHVGGIAVFERQGWAFVSDEEAGKVRRYPLERLRQAVESSSHLAETEPAQPVYGASFLTSHGPTDTLWAGRFSSTGRERMRSYTVAGDGTVAPRDGTFEVPRKTQGVVVTDDLFVYSTSFGRPNRSNIYVVQRGEGSSDLDTARLFCFRAPSMAEGMAVHGADVHLVYESGAAYYAQDAEQPINIIKELHQAPLAELARLPR